MVQNSHSSGLERDVVELIPALRAFASRFYRSETDIEDLVQETLAKSLANIDKFEPGTRLKSWMFTIMRNTFCTRFGVSKREHVGFDDCVADRSSVAATQEWSVRGHELERAVMRLPVHYRTAIQYIFIDGISYESAAARCDCALGTMKSRVSRARQHLARELGEELR